MKSHQVHYSVGCAGHYLLHVGLRQKAHLLPGSPFVLEVRPGPAHALSTALDPALLPLETIVGTTGRILLPMCDNMGNRCIVNTKAVEATCEDQGDGSYLITWKGETAGAFPFAVTLHGAHVVHSPTVLHMHQLSSRSRAAS